MYRNRLLVTILVIFAVGATPASSAAQQTAAADAVVESAGVNLHLHYFGTAYNQFPLIRSRLIELGVRHVRDGLVDTEWQDYYNRFNELGRAGIHTIFITAPDQSTELWASYPARMPHAFEAFEAPNELDKSGRSDWAPTLRQAMTRLGSLRGDPRAARFPIIGPSLSRLESYRELGDVSPWFDVANLHNYLGGRHPGTPGWGANGYGSIAWNIATIGPYAGGKAVVSTETGFHDGGVTIDAIPREVAGRYMPRLLLEQFRRGIARTYLYELIDFQDSGNYGLLDPDGSPKPAFTAVKSLLNLLADPGPPFAAQPLAYQVQGGNADVQHMALQKRDGRYFVALWLAVPGYDLGSRLLLNPASQTVSLALPAPLRVIQQHKWQPDGSLAIIPAAGAPASLAVTVTDAITVVEVAPAGLSLDMVPGIPGTLSATVQDRAVILQWDTPINGGPVTDYVIEAAANGDLAHPVTLTAGPTPRMVVPDVPPGSYVVRVRARNGHGYGAPSNIAQLAVGGPAAPRLQAQQTQNPVVLSWSATSGAERYVLQAGSSPGASDVAVVDLGRATQLITPVPPGARFYVRVTAVSASGVASSNEVAVALSPLNAPTMYQPVVMGSTVRLAWSAGPAGASYTVLARTTPQGPIVASFPLQALGIDVPGVPPGRYYASVVTGSYGHWSGESNLVAVSVP